MDARGINFLCALLHCSLLQWQKTQLGSNHVLCKNESQEEKAGRWLLLHVWGSDAIHRVSHVFLDISAYTENDTWTVQAIFRADSFSFYSSNCFFNTLEYAKCFNKLLIKNKCKQWNQENALAWTRTDLSLYLFCKFLITLWKKSHMLWFKNWACGPQSSDGVTGLCCSLPFPAYLLSKGTGISLWSLFSPSCLAGAVAGCW